MRSRLVIALLACVTNVAEADPAAHRFATRRADARGVAYAAQVADGLYRGGRPDATGVAWLKQLGIRTVLNLRHFHGETEKELVERAGMTYRRAALESSDVPTAAELVEIMKIVLDPALRPLYVHCKHGVDRTGTVMAVYRMEIDHWDNEQALAEMDHFGAHKIWRDLREFVRSYHPLGSYKMTQSAAR